MEQLAEYPKQSAWWQSWHQEPPENTRDKILYAAFCEVHLNGFQAASIQNIINSAGVTKGALYHYFSSKDEIGYALLDEIFTQYIENTFIEVMRDTDDPIAVLVKHLNETGAQMSEEDIALGCPLDHFSQEMAPIDTEFQKRLDHLYKKKHTALVDALKRGQEAGNVTRDVAAESIAMMINATMQGCMAMAKNSRSLEMLMQCGAGLIHYLEQLRPSI
ncbi:MAG: TetR/AcrR family transcriptional regulator [Arenicellales bacterium]